MIEILGKISFQKVEEVVKHLNVHIEPHLGFDVSNYAKGRRRTWLQYEAPLSGRQRWKHGSKDEYLWNFVLETFAPYEIVPELGLVSKGGTIDFHRDAAYAEFKAFAINLGVVTWEYEMSYPLYDWVPESQLIYPPKLITFDMQGGEVFQFNSKNRHRAINSHPERWGFNLWNIKQQAREERDYQLSNRNVLKEYNINFK
jgi:hypothetical protein